MSNRILQLSAASIMLVGTPTLANADVISYGTTAPIAITAFRVNESMTLVGSGDEQGPPQFTTNGITINFVNKSSVPAMTVTFLLRDGDYLQRIVDKGTFSPATQINHTFAIEDTIDTFTDATVNVAEVDFADGSAWHIPAPIADLAQTTVPAGTTMAKATIAPVSISADQAKLNQSTDDTRRMLFRNQGTGL